MSLKRRLSEPGIVVSALVHVGVLAATLIAFSSNEKFDDIQETVPVEVVTDNQFNQIMKGDKSAKEVHPEAVAKAEQAAPETTEQPNQPAPAKSPSAPPPPPPPVPPVRDVQEKPPAQPQPPPPAVLPPPRPAPPQPEATPPVPIPPVRDVSEEPDLPKPVPKPPLKPVVKPVPTPPVVPHPIVAKVPEPKPVPKPRPVDRPKPDQVAKLMEELPTDATPPATPNTPPNPSKSRLSHTTSDTGKFDPTDISKLLNSSVPAQRPSTSHEPSRLASLGSPTASAPKMSPSFWAGLDGVMEDQYRQCWSYLGLNAGVKYVPQIRVVYSSSGSLEGEPVLVNPPSDPSLRSLADSAMRAVRRCNPLKIPDQYAPYYDQWKGRVLRFDPEEMAG